MTLTLRRFAALARAALIGALVTAAAPAALAQSAMTAEERTALRAEIRAFLLEEPELIVEVLDTLEQRRREQQEQSAQDALASNADLLMRDGFSYVGGNPDGDVTMVEFIDYRCGYCKRAHPHVLDLLAADGELRFVVKEFPILGPDSVFAGRAALASLRQKDGALYKPFHDAMIEHRGALTETVVKQLAREVGLEIALLELDMADPEIEKQLQSTYELAGQLGINGTPAFVIGNQIVRGFVPSDQMAGLVAAARAAQ